MSSEPTPGRFRFCAIADCHFAATTAFADQGVIEDINKLQPDFSVVLGDISGWPGAGGEEMTRRAVQLLKGLQMPWRNLIGNHDLENRDIPTDRDNVLMWIRAHGYKLPWHREDRGPLTFLFLSTERFREHTIQPHEVWLSPRQIKWADEQLAACAARPVVVACHAPPLGSNLAVKADLHVRAGNAYVNQNHAPGQIMDLCYRHKNILFWFCGHSHLSQARPDAVVNTLGIHFVHVGTTNPSQAREIKRHSRVVEVEPQRIVLRTFDHDRRAIDESLDVVIPQGLESLMAARAQTAR